MTDEIETRINQIVNHFLNAKYSEHFLSGSAFEMELRELVNLALQHEA